MGLASVIEELQPTIGSEVHGPWLTMTQERIDEFAKATGDFQWIHVNPQKAAAESPFGETIAHGFLTLALIPFLAEMVNPEKPQIAGAQRLINYGLNKVRFPAPVPPGTKIRARSELLNVQEVKGALEIVRKVTIEIENAEKPACVAETVTRAFFE
ncbi:MAG: MaoC family dehydratase [SAR324 cluster bacterium]|nr:MaoC family dehydratase [SAR324 cluster bacterium]MBL7035589.1 MaoC family dehydratase [SAR324 cluster bacterium]